MAKLWLGKVRALFHFILSLRIDMKKRVYRNFDTPSFLKNNGMFRIAFIGKIQIAKNETYMSLLM